MKIGMDTAETGAAADRLLLEHSGPDRKRTVLLLRSVVIATTAYLVFGATRGVGWEQIALVVAFALSNAALALMPERIFWMPHFGPLLLLADTGLIVLGFTWSQGVAQELLIAYFLTLFLITAGETIGQIAIGSALIAFLYGYWVWQSGVPVAVQTAWVPVPFFFLVAVFYASLIDELKRERRRRHEAEGQNRGLRLLLDVANTLSESQPSLDFVHRLGRFVEATCPGLECRLTVGPSTAGSPGRRSFPLRAHGRHYGDLSIRKTGSRRLSDHETWLCQMVAHAAAGALHAVEQTSASQSADEAKEQFLSTLSHELRTPLHAILGYLEMLAPLTAGAADADLRAGVDRMRVHAEQLRRLLEELLALAEIRSGGSRIEIESVDVGGLLEEIAARARDLAAGKALKVVTAVAPGANPIWSDATKLRTVLSCLVDNAVKFTAAGEVALSVSAVEPDRIQISIEDTGIGIAPSDLPLAFDDFRQVDGSPTRRYGGLGIGLPLASEIIELLGGALAVESEPGRGTSVRVVLPIRHEPPRETSRAGWPALDPQVP
jgi:signal transduction histidine kinase